MKKQNLSKYAKKVVAILTLLVMTYAYMPTINYIVEAVENEDVKEQNTAQKDENNSALTEEKDNGKSNETEKDVNEASESSTENESNNITNEANAKAVDEEQKTEVTINDKVLKQYLLDNHDYDKDGIITDSDIAQIKELNIYYNVKDLTGLENATNVESLRLGTDSCTKIEILYNLPKLKVLTLDSYDAASLITYFKALNNLEKLSLYYSNNAISISTIADLVNLKELSISEYNRSNAFDINALEKLVNLEKLELSENGKVINFESIGKFNKLKSLTINNQTIEDLTPIKSLTNLKNLGITTVDSDANMKILKELNLDELNYKQIIQDVYVEKGKKTEIPATSILSKLKDSSSPIYSENIYSSSSDIAISEDNTKIVIDGTEKEVGSSNGYIYGHYNKTDETSGINKSVNVNIEVKYTVRESVSEKTEVTMPDEELKKYLLKNYDADGDKVLTNYDMLQITSLYIDSYDIKDITGIDSAKNLSYLSLYREFAGMSALVNLPNLETLSVSDFKMDTLNKLDVLKKIKKLTISNYSSSNKLDYSYLGTLTNLTSLTVYDRNRTETIDLNDLKNLTNLTELNIEAPVQISNTEVLTNLKNMTKLGLNTTDKLSDISFISELTWLETLDLSNNNISDITPLRSLTKLHNLDLMKNPINTKESETAETLEILRNKEEWINISIIETNSTANIEFKDENFKNALIKSSGADLNKDNQISVEEMERVNYIYLTDSKQHITSIDEIVYATNLNSIYMSSEIDDISPITKLPRLRSINISDKAMTDKNIQVVSSLDKLRYLNISFNSNSIGWTLNSLEKFSNMKMLQELTISAYNYNSQGEKKIFDLKGLDSLTELTRLELRGSVSNINLVKKLPNLNNLTFTNEIYNSQGDKLTDKEILDFAKSLNVETYRLITNGNIEINLGNILLNSDQQVNLANVNNELIKSIFTSDGIFYDENTTVSYHDYSETGSEQIKGHPIIINTKKLGDKTIYVYISNSKINVNINLRWKNYIKGDTSKEINIPDEKLKEVLLQDYDIEPDGKITDQDMINIIDLDAYDHGISNLEGLQYAKNMEYVGLGSNYITNINPLLNITTIKNIDLLCNFITDISLVKDAKWADLGYISLNNNYIDFNKDNNSVAALTNLLKTIDEEYYDYETELNNIMNSQYEDSISEIDNEVDLENALKEKIIKLGVDSNKDGKITRREMRYYNTYEEYIDLSNANIANISGIEYFNGYSINLADNSIVDITPITKNKHFYNIDISNNNIMSLAGLENIYNLRYINASNNKIVDITPITNLHYMKNNTEWREIYINLSNNQISNIDCVKDWKNLRTLDLSGNKITNIKELKNYNFKLYNDMTDDMMNECATDLTINLSENNIDMTNPDNKNAKAVFDQRGADLKLVDNSKTTEYVLNKNGIYSSDSNLGIVNTELSIRGAYEFIPEKDRTYYPGDSDKNLKGIFVNTRYFINNPEHEADIKDRGYETEVVVTGAIRTAKALEGTGTITFILKLPEEYVGGEAILSGEGNITKRTRNTIGLEIPVHSSEDDTTYYTINTRIILKAKEYKIKDNNNKDEILNAINNEQNVTMDMKTNVTNVDKELFEKLSKTENENVELKVQTANATWKFNSGDINNTGVSVNPTVTIANNKFENMDKAPFEDAIYLKFDHEGELPGKAEIELDVSKNNIYEKGKTVYLYYYNSQTKKYEYISTLQAGDKKITISLTHCSEYVISDKMLYTLGDVDNNGKIDARDAVQVLKHIAQNITLEGNRLLAADTNKDGKISASDAVQILKYVAGNITEF